MRAGFDSDCGECALTMFQGDEIKPHPDGEWVHEVRMPEREDEDETPRPRRQSSTPATEADLFLDPDEIGERKPARPGLDPEIVEAAQRFLKQDDDDYLNVSGQPKSRYEWHGKQQRGYACADPRTGVVRTYKTSGKPQGWTRVTTFNKAATDQNALTDWAKRNVLMGAALRPDLVKAAEGLTHEDKDALGSLIGQLETAAGAKVSADWGTVVHEITELIDGGALAVAEVPESFRGPVKLYLAALKEHKLRPVPGLIERTVFCDLFGGVAGTFDRVYLHEPSGQYLIGDVKTGKTLEYGMDEIETQEWVYAYGINCFGVYDWNTDTWEKPGDTGDPLNVVNWGPQYAGLHVSESWGVIIHLPAQGPKAGTCNVVRADLQRGKRHAEVCHAVRQQRSAKPRPVLFTEDILEPAAEPPTAVDWVHRFRNVDSEDEAAQFWEDARAAGVNPTSLKLLANLALNRLAEGGTDKA